MQHTVRLLVAAGLTLSGAWCQAQPIPLNPPQPQFTDPEVSRLQREVRNPRHISALLQARGLLSTNPERAIDTLQPLLDTPEDSPFSDQGGYSVKDQAEELLRSAGTEILDQYERRFAATAQAILNDAPTQRRAEALREVARRFGLTSVGLDALQRLTIMAVDAGDSSSAGRFCQRLKRDPRSAAFEPRLSLIQAWSQVRSGRSAQAEQTLAALRDANPGPLVLDGQNIPWFQSADAIDRWLSGLFPAVGNPDDAEGLPYWELAHGDLLRNAASAAAPPVLDDGWSYPLVDEHDDYVRPDNILQTLSILKDLDEKLRTAMQSTPVAEPLLLRNMLIVSGLGSLKALSLESGQLVWSSVPVDDTLARLFADTEPQLVEGKQELLRLLAAQRAFRDLVHTSLSSDGRRVYRVGQGGLVGSPMVNMMGAASIRGTDPLIPRLYNSLQAYEVSGGKLRWEKGGPPRMVLEEEDRLRAESDLVGAFFLSAPIPWSGQLLCLIEQGNQIELAALEPESGEPLWIQPLLNSDPLANLQNAPDRRFAGVSAALDGSTLIAVLGN